MDNIVKMTKIKVFFGLAVLIVAYLYFSSPNKVVVNKFGEVKGLVNNARYALQGKAFWKDQLREVISELQWELSEPQRQANQERFREEMYRKHPDMRPFTPAERQAETLRKEADQIEHAEFYRFIEKIRLERIAELRKILPIVKAKTE